MFMFYEMDSCNILLTRFTIKSVNISKSKMQHWTYRTYGHRWTDSRWVLEDNGRTWTWSFTQAFWGVLCILRFTMKQINSKFQHLFILLHAHNIYLYKDVLLFCSLKLTMSLEFVKSCHLQNSVNSIHARALINMTSLDYKYLYFWSVLPVWSFQIDH